jgi:hypothetical protein
MPVRSPALHATTSIEGARVLGGHRQPEGGRYTNAASSAQSGDLELAALGYARPHVWLECRPVDAPATDSRSRSR